MAQVTVWRVYLHSPPVSITLFICILDTEEKNAVFIITRQQQEKQSKGEIESHQTNLMKNRVCCQSQRSDLILREVLFHVEVFSQVDEM